MVRFPPQMPAESASASRRRRNFARELAEKGWYHSFELPDGRVIEGVLSLEQLRRRVARFDIPDDLRGKRVLDIGAWDGWFSFEMERRGAEVVAVDCVEIDHFLDMHRMLGSRVEYKILDLYELSPQKLGRFDIVLFLGVLYHVKHPLLGLEIVCRMTKDMAIVESFIAQDGSGEGHTDLPYMEFYESDELGGLLDNWFGPTVDCLMGLCRAAGFARVTLREIQDQTACLACHRKWDDVAPTANLEAPELVDVQHCRNYGINFDTRKDEYVGCSFACSELNLVREDIMVEIGEFAAAPIWIGRLEPGRWQANCMLPPGIEPGWREVRLRTRMSHFSAPRRIAVDLPITTDRLVLGDVCDAATWRRGEILGEFTSFWITGLPEHADRNNVEAYLGGARLAVEYISAPDANGYRQVNARLKRPVDPGEHTFQVRFGDVESARATVRVARAA